MPLPITDEISDRWRWHCRSIREVVVAVAAGGVSADAPIRQFAWATALLHQLTHLDCILQHLGAIILFELF